MISANKNVIDYTKILLILLNIKIFSQSGNALLKGPRPLVVKNISPELYLGTIPIKLNHVAQTILSTYSHAFFREHFF